jgi:hypothetical protein
MYFLDRMFFPFLFFFFIVVLGIHGDIYITQEPGNLEKFTHYS